MIPFRIALRLALSVLVHPLTLLAQSPPGPGFTYQGRLEASGAGVTGPADMRFSLWDADTGGMRVGQTITFDGVAPNPPSVPVTDGLFTVELNAADQFGPQAHLGKRWLQVEVRFPAGAGMYTVLNPRQPVTGAPLSHRLVEACVFRPEDFGAKRDDHADDSAAFNAAFGAMAAAACRSRILELSEGTYNLSSSLIPPASFSLVIRGPAAAASDEPSARLFFRWGVPGLVLTPPPAGPLFGVTIENVIFASSTRGPSDPPTSTASGIWAQRPIRLGHVWAQGFAGHGFFIDTTAPRSGASEWALQSCRAEGNGRGDPGAPGHGLYIDGPDSNSGVAMNFSAAANAGWGVFDSSLLGNTFVACRTDANGTVPGIGGAYRVERGGGQPETARSVFVGCSAELRQNPSSIPSPSVWIGGAAASPPGTDAVVGSGIILRESNTLAGAGQLSNPLVVKNDGPIVPNDPRYADPELRFVSGGANGSVLEWHSGFDSALPWRLRYQAYTPPQGAAPDYGWYRLDFGALDAKTPLLLSGDRADLGSGHLWMTRFFLGPLALPSARIRTGAGPLGLRPTLSTPAEPWPRGSIFWDSAPAPGGYSGWRATSVSPEGVITWKGFGLIEP